ncbi:DUF4983 domain-containing protein [Chitinophaga polysaccharea]|uniref:DUF4983 domain-containing protein n=1 Tax=Chitinophaga TaxID=79328 RepID=UPI00145536ED|nr:MULTISPECIES: DUF4983 domain-containing protein [Chitinophaga]NLR59481.1 DUF4983 domain-containing protein [Chitinophaga polysaccharea]NLU96115.1 DUF4983 domain-containing protein [Chitinophaga sp. Ak27]
MNIYKTGRRWLAVMIGMITAIAACNKGLDHAPVKHYDDPTNVTVKQPKILMLVIDGARGEAVRDAPAPQLTAMEDSAIYCWNSISDTISLDATGWADLLTGVHKEKHGVVSEDMSNNSLSQYPVFFKYIKGRNPGYRIAAFSAADDLGKKLITNADVNKTFANNDDAVQQALLNELKVDTAGLVFGQFSQVALAGAAHGYESGTPEYKAAILKVDGYVSELLAALKKRPSYNKESWLIVVTSNRGGAVVPNPQTDDGTILSNGKVNTFTIFYSPRYMPSFIDRPFTGNRYTGKSVRLYGDNTANAIYATIDSGKADYNLGDTTDATIELKIKKNKSHSGDYAFTWPSIIGNNMSMDWWHNTGWNMSLEQNNWGVHFGQNTPVFNANNMITGGNIGDGKWHDLAAVFYRRDNKRYLRLLTDGQYNGEIDITGYGSFDTDAPLTLGFMPGNVSDNRWLDAYVTEVKFFKAAIPDDVIKTYVCADQLPTSHPYYDYLAGYWSCKDGFGGVFKDQSSLKHDFQLKGNYAWDDFNDLMCPTANTNLSQLVPQPVDVVRQILSWLQIPADTNWNLDGRVWITTYANVGI